MDTPFLFMIAGPNGSGKTTLTLRLRERGFDFGEYINPDDIAAGLEGSYEARVQEAQRVADRRRDQCVAERRSFSFETVMSHPSKIEILQRAKAAGFLVQFYFVGTEDPRMNVDRVAFRVSKGGHDVPTDRIVARWHRTMSFLADAVKASDLSLIFDNSTVGRTLRGPRAVVEIRGSHDRLTVARRFPPIPDWVRTFLLDRL